MTTPQRTTPSNAELALLVVGMVLPTLSAWLYFHQWAGTPVMMPLYTIGKIVQFGLPILWAWRYARRWPSGVLAARGIAAGLAFGVVAAAAMVAGYWWWLVGTPEWHSAAQRIAEKLGQAGFSAPPAFLAMAIFYSLVHSGMEEYFWRWFIFGRLEAWLRPIAATILASLAFASHHALIIGAFFPGQWIMTAVLTLGVAIGGAAWCTLYRRSGSLLGPWMGHALVDATLMAIGYSMIQQV